MALTRSGICYNLKDSPFRVEYKGFMFYFSSLAHRDNFAERVNGRVEWLNDSLSRRFHVRIDTGMLALFQLYMQVETRGFYVIDCMGDACDSIDDYDFSVTVI